MDTGTPVPFLDVRLTHGEGPWWDERSGRLMVVDLVVGDLVAAAPAAPGEVVTPSVTHVDDVLAFLRPRADGGWAALAADSLLLLDDDLRVLDRHRLHSDPTVRFNDGGCDAGGTLYAGTMAWDEREGAGFLLRVGPDGAADVVVPSASVANGLAPVPGSSSVYWADSPTGRVDVLDPATGGRTPFLSVPEDQGVPDGLCVDADGGVWVALHGGSRVVRHGPDGARTHEVRLPTAGVTSCAFGGSDRSTLFVTTMGQGAPDDDDLAGAVFAVPTSFTGAPTPSVRW